MSTVAIGLPARHPVRRALTEPFSLRTWRETAYALSALPLGVLWFSLVVTFMATSLGLIITLVGLPLLALSLYLVRYAAIFERWWAKALLHVDVPAPPDRPVAPDAGWLRRLWNAIAQPPRWRETAYLVLLLPQGIALFVVAIVLWSLAAAGVWRPLMEPFLPASSHVEYGNGNVVDTPLEWAGVFLIGLVALLAAPWVIRGLVALHVLLLRGLLGPTQAELARAAAQVAAERDAAISSAEHDRRQLERDLHDGAQARLVALAADLGRARQRLEQGGSSEEATQLVQEAHEEAKVVLREIRDLARGIHPAILSDRGLDAALSQLAARSALSVQVSCHVEGRLPEQVESAAYYLVSEALVNAARHGGGQHAAVLVSEQDGTLLVEVRDDGRGGADPSRGTGLSGLLDRVAALGGTLEIDSPPGGPTLLSAELPCG
jgi:signal transduction histidine kinase